MANVITLNSPGPPEYIQRFIDSFGETQRASADNDFRDRQLAQQGQYQSGMLDVQRGNLDVNKGQLGIQQEELKAKQLQQEATGVVEEIGRLFDSGQRDKAAKRINQVKSSRPDLVPYISAAAARMIQTPADVETQNAQKTFTDSSGAMAGGSPTPTQADIFYHRNFKGGMSPQMTEETQMRQPEAAPAPKGKTASPVTDYYRTKGGLQPSGAQKLAAETDIKQTGMREAGATTRTKMQEEGDTTRVAMPGAGQPNSTASKMMTQASKYSDAAVRLKTALANARPIGHESPEMFAGRIAKMAKQAGEFEEKANTIRQRYSTQAPAEGQSATPKPGDTKTFPNGKVGKWDGKGWVQVQ